MPTMTGKEIRQIRARGASALRENAQHPGAGVRCRPGAVGSGPCVQSAAQGTGIQREDGPVSSDGCNGRCRAGSRASVCLCARRGRTARSARFARFIASTNSNETTVEQLDADIARLARHFVSRPLKELYAEIRELRDETFDLLRGRQRPQQTSDLLVAANSSVCRPASALDAGDYDSAGTRRALPGPARRLPGTTRCRAWVPGRLSRSLPFGRATRSERRTSPRRSALRGPRERGIARLASLRQGLSQSPVTHKAPSRR